MWERSPISKEIQNKSSMAVVIWYSQTAPSIREPGGMDKLMAKARCIMQTGMYTPETLLVTKLLVKELLQKKMGPNMKVTGSMAWDMAKESRNILMGLFTMENSLEVRRVEKVT